MRKPIIAGNWKLFKNSKEALELVTVLKRELCDITKVDIVVCPVFLVIRDVYEALMESNIGVGAQDVYWEDSGAFTGEVSAPLIKDAGAQYVIIGHSERRQFFGETNQTVNKKIKAALKHGLTPIVCIGEVLQEREEGKTFDVLNKQCTESLAGLSTTKCKKSLLLMNRFGRLAQEKPRLLTKPRKRINIFEGFWQNYLIKKWQMSFVFNTAEALNQIILKNLWRNLIWMGLWSVEPV